jgi:hypothetical protein
LQRKHSYLPPLVLFLFFPSSHAQATEKKRMEWQKGKTTMKLQNSVLILIAIVCVGFLRSAQAVTPAPDGGYPGGNTAEGTKALLSLTTGTYNTAIGIYSLLSLTDGSFCTGVGAGTLLVNTADNNTATGAGALLSNTTASGNTATGAFALFNNIVGNGNTATGDRTLFNNTEGTSNTAMGTGALFFNTDGNTNTALGVVRSLATLKAAPTLPSAVLPSMIRQQAPITPPTG